MLHMTSNQTDRKQRVYASRRRAVYRHVTRKQKVDAIVVTNPSDIGYLSGFTGVEHRSAILVCGNKWEVMIPGRFYRQLAMKECSTLEIYQADNASYGAVGEVLKGRRVRALGIQADFTTVVERKKISDVLPAKRIVELQNITGASRVRKDEQEIKHIRKAARIAKTAFEQLIADGCSSVVGRQEQDLAADLEYRMKSLGASGPSFQTIVASGPNSSRCHHIPGRRRIRPGEPLLIDWGAMVNGYCSDLTRTLFTGRISRRFEQMYSVVQEAARTALAAVRPGVRCRVIDAAARNVIVAAGLGDNFIHGLGHGIGRNVHESPVVSSSSNDTLRAGMVVTIEPGVYFPGTGGVRIEDDVVVTRSGAIKLSGPSSRLSNMVLKD